MCVVIGALIGILVLTCLPVLPDFSILCFGWLILGLSFLPKVFIKSGEPPAPPDLQVNNGLFLFQEKLKQIYVHRYSAKFFLLLLGFMMGCTWGVYRANRLLAFTLPSPLENKELRITGFVDALPEEKGDTTSFIFELESINGQISPAKPNLKLTWARAPLLAPGEYWKLQVRLKRPRGFANPGGFDLEKQLFFQHVRAIGQVKKSTLNQKSEKISKSYPIQTLRKIIREKISDLLPGAALKGAILGLVIGETSQITSNEWDVFRRTGTTHLMAISGLHITLLSGFVFWMGQFCWRRFFRAPLFLPAPQAAAILSILVAVFYSLLAGFSIPTQRSCVMIVCALLGILFKKAYTVWMLWFVSLGAVLILDPFSVLSPGFWLSFFAVGIIFYGMHHRLSPEGFVWKFSRIHVLMAIGLFPLTAFFFKQVSLIGVIANFFAVPWVSFVVTPIALCGTLFLPLSVGVANFLLEISLSALSLLWVGLTYLGDHPFSEWLMPIVPIHILALAVLGILLLLAPKGIYGRHLGLFFFLPFCFLSAEKPKIGDAKLTVLDVGQGLSVVIETAQHTLVYDVGAKFGQFNAATSIVKPFLQGTGHKNIDILMVSHLDNDHLGGAEDLAKHFAIKRVLTSEPEKLTWTQSDFCGTQTPWVWEGVYFKVLSPTLQYDKRNNRSCVLLVKTKGASALLPGDIESLVEWDLIEQDSQALDVDIMVAPHHGSRTSSTLDFIKTVSPMYVVYAAGAFNRYKLPHPKIEERYQALGVIPLTTWKTGAVSFYLQAQNELKAPITDRFKNQHWWQP